MIARDLKEYPYYLYDTVDEYGQQVMGAEPTGEIVAAIYQRTKRVTDAPIYAEADYIALTPDELPDSMVIDYNGQALKVLYSIPLGHFKQAFLKSGGAL